jgi:FkbM family methyltransferase
MAEPAWELWCPSPLKEWTPCRLPWHVFLLTYLLPIAACTAIAAIFLLSASILNLGQKNVQAKKVPAPLLGRRRRRVLIWLCVLLGLLVLTIMDNLQSAWIGTDIWPVFWYKAFIGVALSRSWYRFGLDQQPWAAVDTPALVPKLTFIDVGARTFQTSPTWFIENYPRGAEFNIVAFELDPGVKDSFEDRPNVELRTEAVGTQNKQVRFEIAGIAGHEVEVGAKGDDCARCVTVRMIDFAEYLTKNFQLADYVAVKIDVEGGEYELFEHLLKTGAVSLLDELFVEWHGWRHAATAAKIADLQGRLSAAGVQRMHWWL